MVLWLRLLLQGVGGFLRLLRRPVELVIRIGGRERILRCRARSLIHETGQQLLVAYTRIIPGIFLQRMVAGSSTTLRLRARSGNFHVFQGHTS